MSVTKLSEGIPLLLTQTTPYALPPKVVRVTATAEVDISPDNTASWFATTAATNAGQEVMGTHIRCTAATNCTVVVARVGG